MSEAILNPSDFVFTRDAALIDAFVDLQNQFRDNDEKCQGFRYFHYFDGAQSKYYCDDANVLIALCQEKVVGGICYSVSSLDASKLLPLEYDIRTTVPEFRICHAFPEIDFGRQSYCEPNGLFIHPDFRGGLVLKGIINSAKEFCISHGICNMFALTDPVRARAYRQICTLIDMICSTNTLFRIPENPDYEHRKMNLLRILIPEKCFSMQESVT